jgi:hypothetical protein
LFVGQAMWYGGDNEGKSLCREEGERVSHQGFGSTFVVDPGAKHGIACHCCSQDSSIFSSSLALDMDLDDSFIFSWDLWSLGCKSTVDLSYSFSTFRKKTLKSCQGRRVSWPCLIPYHMHFHQSYIIWGKKQWNWFAKALQNDVWHSQASSEARIAASKSSGSWPRESKVKVVELQESKARDKEEENLYFQRRRFVYIHCFEAEARMAGFQSRWGGE